MSDFLKRNLVFLREVKNESQIETATILGLSRSTYANYETGANLPKADMIMKIIGHFGVSFEKIMKEDLANGAKASDNKAHLYGVKHGVKHGVKSTKKGDITTIPEPIISYGDHAPNVYDVRSKAAAGTMIHIMQPEDKHRPTPNLYLPGLGSGMHIRFPIGGDSMHSTIKDGDKVVATLITDIQNIRPGFVYVILDKDDGVVCKRLYWEGKETLELVSDNEIYSPYKRNLNDLLAIFKVKEVHSKDLRPYFQDVRKEMRDIRSEMAAIRHLITN